MNIRAGLTRILLPEETRDFVLTFLVCTLGSGPVAALVLSQPLHLNKVLPAIFLFLPIFVIVTFIARITHKLLRKRYAQMGTHLTMVFLGSLVGSTLRYFMSK